MGLCVRAITRFIAETLADFASIITSREKLGQVLGKPLYANSLYLLISRAFDPLFGFFFWVLAARLYTTSSIGMASAAVSSASLLAVIASLGLGFGLIRFLPDAGVKTGKLLNSCFSLGVICSLAIAAVFILGLGFWSTALLPIKASLPYLLFFFILTAGLTMAQMLDQPFLTRHRGDLIFIRAVVFNIGRLAILIPLAALLPGAGIITSWAASLFILTAVGLLYLLPKAYAGYRFSFGIDTNSIRRIVRFTFSNYLSQLFFIATGLMMPLLVINILGAETNAYFYIGWTMGNIINIIAMAASTSLFVEGSAAEAMLKQHLRQSIKITLIILLPVVLLLLLLAKWILLVFFGPDYAANGTTLVQLLAVSSLFYFVNVTYLAIQRVRKKLVNVIVFSGVVMLVILVTARLLLPVMGVNGAGIAWLVSHFMASLVVIIGYLTGGGLKNDVNGQETSVKS